MQGCMRMSLRYMLPARQSFFENFTHPVSKKLFYKLPKRGRPFKNKSLPTICNARVPNPPAETCAETRHIPIQSCYAKTASRFATGLPPCKTVHPTDAYSARGDNAYHANYLQPAYKHGSPSDKQPETSDPANFCFWHLPFLPPPRKYQLQTTSL